ncbi:hypothetical protein Y032_0357g3381 [Ancylostoma ceylanicum]|nr:hypothetical protein Y032_0357g3381 [Ancylostoma ceylanicum]
MRWANMLIGYDFDIEYIKNDSFGQADGLSRLIQRHPLTQEDCVIASFEVDVKQMSADAVQRLPVSDESIRKQTGKRVVLRKLRSFTDSGRWPKVVEGA